MSWPLDHRGVEEAVGLAPTRAYTPACFRDRFLIWPVASMEPSVGAAPTTSSLPKTCSGLLSYEGLASPARFERAAPTFGGWCSLHLSYGESASTAGVEPALSGFVDRRLHPFGHVDSEPTANRGPSATGGTCTRDLRLDGPVLPLAELRRLGARPGPRTQARPG